MASIIKTINTRASADTAWGMIGDVGAVPALVSLISECRIDGDRRHCIMADGSQLTERVVTIDDAHRRLVYTVTDGPMPLEFHVAAVTVEPASNGATVTWRVDVLPDALAEPFAPMMEMVAQSMAENLDKSAVSA